MTTQPKYTSIPTVNVGVDTLEELNQIINDATKNIQINGGGGSTDLTPVIKEIRDLKLEIIKEANETQVTLGQMKQVDDLIKTTVEKINASVEAITLKQISKEDLKLQLKDIEDLLTSIKDKPSSGTGIDYTDKLDTLLTELTHINQNTDTLEVKTDSVKLVLDNTLSTLTDFKNDIKARIDSLLTQTDEIEPLLKEIKNVLEGGFTSLKSESDDTQSKLEEIRLLTSDLKELKVASNTFENSIKEILVNIETKIITQEQLDTVLVDIESLLTLIKDKPSGSTTIDYTNKLEQLHTDLSNILSGVDGLEPNLDLVRTTVDELLTTVQSLKNEVNVRLLSIVANTDEIEPKLDAIIGHIDEIESKLSPLIGINLSITNIKNILNKQAECGLADVNWQTPTSVGALGDLDFYSLDIEVVSNVATITDIKSGTTRQLHSGERLNFGNGFKSLYLSNLKFQGDFKFTWEVYI